MRRNPSKREVIWRNTEKGYGLVHIVLHWTVAAMIALMLPLGLWMTGLDYYDPWYKKGPDLHRSIGVLLGLIMLVRIAWRLGNLRPAPVLPPGRELKLARAAHLLLYLLPLLLIVSGYLISTADGRAVDAEPTVLLRHATGQRPIAGPDPLDQGAGRVGVGWRGAHWVA